MSKRKVTVKQIDLTTITLSLGFFWKSVLLLAILQTFLKGEYFASSEWPGWARSSKMNLSHLEGSEILSEISLGLTLGEKKKKMHLFLSWSIYGMLLNIN